jgi:hypothetical protein
LSIANSTLNRDTFKNEPDGGYPLREKQLGQWAKYGGNQGGNFAHWGSELFDVFWRLSHSSGISARNLKTHRTLTVYQR